MKTHTEILPFLKKYGVYILLIFLSSFFFVLALLMPVSYGGADDIVHYRFARHSFQHPELLLDHWAKPFFTLLASPFAQLGYWGVKLFNLLVGAFTAIIMYRMAQLMQFRRNILVIVILFFTPVYTTMLMSGMTEVLFAALLTLASYLFLRKDFIWSAVVISFLPLVRTEGIVIWPCFAMAFLFHKKWKAIPFILTGSFIYSIIGGLYFKDFLWLYTHIPYTGTYDIYGHGDLLHFVKSNKAVFGIPVTILFLIGLIATIRKKKYPGEKSKTQAWDEIFVILAPLLVYYLAHSYVWWKGINSMGLIRVMAGVAPLFAFYGLRGLNFLIDSVSLRFLRAIIAIVSLALIIITPFRVYEIPMKLTEKDETVKKAAEWFGSSPYKDRKYYVWDSFFYFFLGTDPYDTSKMADGIPDRINPENLVKSGEIVIWDAHFSAVDGRFPLNSIIDNPYYRLINVIRPSRPFEAGGGTYQLCFFERLDSAVGHHNRKLLDSIAGIGTLREIILKQHAYPSNQNNPGLKIQPGDEYIMLYETEVEKEDWDDGDMLGIRVTGSGKQMTLAVSVGNDQKAWFYESFNIKSSVSPSNEEFRVLLPAIKARKQKLKVYIWNKEREEAFLEQFEIKLLKQ